MCFDENLSRYFTMKTTFFADSTLFPLIANFIYSSYLNMFSMFYDGLPEYTDRELGNHGKIMRRPVFYF